MTTADSGRPSRPAGTILALGGGGFSVGESPLLDDLLLDLARPRAERRGHGGAQLAGGEQQMLAIGRALLLNPKLLVMDDVVQRYIVRGSLVIVKLHGSDGRIVYSSEGGITGQRFPLDAKAQAVLDGGEEVVVLNTGSGLIYPDIVAADAPVLATDGIIP